MNKNERQGHFGKAGLRQEFVILAVALLLATALPALTALLFALPVRQGRGEKIGGRSQVEIYCHGTGERTEDTLNGVLILALAASNRSDTPAAALEAEAVVLRSRALWWLDYCAGEGEPPARKGLHRLCDHGAHGLPYRSRQDMVASYGEGEVIARMDAARRAVEGTDGQVLCYGGELIPAMVHSASAGETRQVEGIEWLRSVSSPEAPDPCPLYLPAQDVRAALAARFGLELSADPREWGLELDSAGGISRMVRVGGEAVSATLFAHALSIPSANFRVEAAKDGLVITALGQGSGCGLSRAGAAIYAAGGLCYSEILAHYYPDCTLGRGW